MKNILKKSFFFWLPFAAVITFACLLAYVVIQQDIRQSANDPQIQIAEDVSQALASGASPSAIIPPGQKIDINKNLDPYIMIFDASGAMIGSSAVLNGQTPAVPAGIFASVRAHGEDKFTWEPIHGIRSAVVVVPVSAPGSGFVLAGRSLRIIETREDSMLHLVELAWLAGLIVMFALIWVMVDYHKKHEAWHIFS